MRITKGDRTSFGRLSDPGVLDNSLLATEELRKEYFNDTQFQYIVDHVGDMFGLQHRSIRTSVVENDLVPMWYDKNGNGAVDKGEIEFRFSMNAQIDTYHRTTRYGKHFMYATARAYGYPIIFGIVAHEVGHLVNLYTMAETRTRAERGMVRRIQTSRMDDRWDELCADYLAGIVLAKAVPRLSHDPMVRFLSTTQADREHPDGYWRVFAVEMGYQWGCNNSPALTSSILQNQNLRRQLLNSFFEVYTQRVYHGVPSVMRITHSPLSDTFMFPCAIDLGLQ